MHNIFWEGPDATENVSFDASPWTLSLSEKFRAFSQLQSDRILPSESGNILSDLRYPARAPLSQLMVAFLGLLVERRRFVWGKRRSTKGSLTSRRSSLASTLSAKP